MTYYSKKVMEHFLHPKHLGKIDNADGLGDTENLRCGDSMKIYIRVGERGGEKYIEDIKFLTMGCGAAIATSDMICDLAKGKTLEKAEKIKFSDIADELGELPAQKLHCAHLAETALKSAINDYKSKNSPS